MKLVQLVILVSMFSGVEAFACANITAGKLTDRSQAKAEATVNALTSKTGAPVAPKKQDSDPNATH